MASSSLRGGACEGRKSCPRQSTTEEVLAGTDEKGVEVADVVVVVFQMTQGAWISSESVETKPHDSSL